jgi:hypothetical protein
MGRVTMQRIREVAMLQRGFTLKLPLMKDA